MKRLRSLLVAGALAGAAAAALAAPAVRMRLPDAPSRFLYDEPGVLSRDERAAIEDTLMALDRRGLEVGVAVFESIQGDAIENVSLALAEKWRPGSAEEDNGALIVVALEERKVRIEVGYGLEGTVTDAAAGRIIRYDIAPAFREGRYGDGLLRAVTSLARVAGGQPLPEPASMPPVVPIGILVVVILLIFIVARAGHQATLSRRGLAGGIPGGTYRGRSGPFWGGFGGGGSGGGGFGGGGSFGGGSFGGGGASGSW